MHAGYGRDVDGTLVVGIRPPVPLMVAAAAAAAGAAAGAAAAASTAAAVARGPLIDSERL